jgi:two-component system LytT family response regulator
MSQCDRIAVLVADDEAPARQRLVDLLSQDADVADVVEAADGRTASEIIRRTRPDLVFLDVQMPEMDGPGVVGSVGSAVMPLTVFVTAHDSHAIFAFEANALDYLLKPFSDERFEVTMARVKTRLRERSMNELGSRVLRMVGSTQAPPPLDLLVVKSAGTTRFLRAREVDWIEAAGVYVTLHVAGKELLYRAALNDLAERLDPAQFVRIHRSAILNVESILHLEPVSHGEFDAVLKSGQRVRVSRTYRAQLERRLGQSL